MVNDVYHTCIFWYSKYTRVILQVMSNQSVFFYTILVIPIVFFLFALQDVTCIDEYVQVYTI